MASPYMTYRMAQKHAQRRECIEAFVKGFFFGTGVGLSLLAGLYVGQTYLAG